MKKLFKIKDEIYHFLLIVFIGSHEECDDFIKKNYNSDGIGIPKTFSGYSVGLESPDGREIIQFIWYDAFPETLVDWVGLSHEVNHMTFKVLKEVGVDDEEAHCYYHDYILKKVLRLLNKEIKRRESKKLTKEKTK